MPENLSFKKGNEGNLPNPLTEGTLYYCIDTGNVYLGGSDGAKIELGKQHLKIKGKDFSLTNNDDLNNRTIPGIYISGDSTLSKTIQNTPINTSGFKLVVLDGYISGRVNQYVTGNSGIIFSRHYTGTSWTNWVELTEMLPSASGDDVGKFLRINSSGKPAWMEVPSAEGVDFSAN